MKKTLKKRVAALLSAMLAVTMLFSACNNGGTTSSGSGESSSGGGTSSGSESPQEVTTLKLFVDEPWWPYTAWEGRLPEYVTSQTGIKFDVTVAADTNALNMMISSGDLGDIVCTANFTRMSDGNLCWSYDELAQKYDGKEFPMHSVLRYVNQASDGKTYVIGCGYSPDSVMKSNPYAAYEGGAIVVRTDIYEEMGSPKITNLDEFEELLAAVKAKYPDMVTLGVNSTHKGRAMKVLMGATVDSSGFVEQDGKVITFIEDPELEDYFLLMNDWYRKGYLSDENLASTSDTQDEELMTAGKLFADVFYDNTADTWNVNLEKAGVDFRVTSLQDWDMDTALVQQNTTGWRGLYVPKSCSNTEAAYKFLKYAYGEGQYTLIWGEEGKDWEWNSEKKEYPKMNYDFQGDNSEAQLKVWGWLCHDGLTNITPGVEAEGQTYENRMYLASIAKTKPVIGMLRITPDSQEQNMMTQLTDLFNTSSADIIRASSAEEAKQKYDDMIAAAKEIGTEHLDTWANEQYEKLAPGYEAIKNATE